VVQNVSQWTGIDSHAPFRCVISGNNVSGCKNGIYAQYSSGTFSMPASQVEIIGNVVTGPATAANSVIGIASLGLAGTPNDSISIIGNMIVACGDFSNNIGALHVDDSTNTKITNNHVVRAVRVGISVFGTCSYVDVSSNIVDGVQAGSSSASYAYLSLTNLTNCLFNENRFRNTTGSGTFTPTQGILYDGTVPSTGIVLSRNRMDTITNRLQRVSGSANVYTDLSWQLETESCPAFTHTCVGGAVIEGTANQFANFRRKPNTTGTFIARPRAVFEPAGTSYRLGVRGNYGDVFVVGVYALDGVTNIVASTSIPGIVLSIDGVYWTD
jgi:parallel beta-helix repeat protein